MHLPIGLTNINMELLIRDLEERFDFSVTPPGKVRTVRYTITVTHDNGKTEYGGTATIGIPVTIDEYEKEMDTK